MKVLHLPFTYFPDPPGGTEIYVAGLVRHLSSLGITSVIAAPSPRPIRESYEAFGHRVYRFPVASPSSLDEMYGAGNPEAAEEVRAVLEAEHPDIVHMHAYTRALSDLVAQAACSANIPVVFTYHTPTVTCQRGSLMRYGTIPCDGQIRVRRCAACFAQLQGAGRASWLLALVPPFVGRLIARSTQEGRWWRALRLTALIARRKRAFASLMASTTVVVAVSEWVRGVLVRNGVPKSDIVLSRQGTDAEPAAVRKLRTDSHGGVRAVMLGRMEATKGLDTIVEAMALVPDLAIQLDVYGVDQSENGIAQPDLLNRIAGDRRIRLCPPFESGNAVNVIASYDVTLVPSRGLETGPLVVLESFAAAVPVVGSKLGGIAERVEDEVNGVLVAPDDPVAWASVLSRIVADPAWLRRLAAGVSPPKSMRIVAEEMRAVYQRALQSGLEVASADRAAPS